MLELRLAGELMMGVFLHTDKIENSWLTGHLLLSQELLKLFVSAGLPEFLLNLFAFLRNGEQKAASQMQALKIYFFCLCWSCRKKKRPTGGFANC